MANEDKNQMSEDAQNNLPKITIKQGAPYEDPMKRQLRDADVLVRRGAGDKRQLHDGSTQVQTNAPHYKKGFFARLLDRVRSFFIRPPLAPPILTDNSAFKPVVNPTAGSTNSQFAPTTPVLNSHLSSLESELDEYNDPRSPHYLGSLPPLPLPPLPPPRREVRFSDKVDIKPGTVYSELEQKSALQFSDEQLQKTQANLENELKLLQSQVPGVMQNVRVTEQSVNRLNTDMLQVQQISKAEERLFERQLPSTEITLRNKKNVSYNLDRTQIDQRCIQTALKSTQAQAQLFLAESDKQQLQAQLDDIKEKICAVKELRAAGKKLDKAEKELARLQEKGADMRLLIPLAQSHVEKCAVEYESKLIDAKEKGVVASSSRRRF